MCEMCDGAIGRVMVENLAEGGTVLVLRNMTTGKVAVLERGDDAMPAPQIGDMFEIHRDEAGDMKVYPLPAAKPN